LIAGVTVVRASHLAELRNSLNAVYTAMGLALPVYSDNPLNGGALIRAVHITELRNAIRTLE
jgi:hypothetical protein